jgi:hypothetical protein
MDGRVARASTKMIRFPKFTPRMGLILAHDLIATAAAVLASFYIRFEDAGLAARWPVLIIMLPPFVAYAGVVYAFCGLLKSKWRFASLPDFMSITCWWRRTCSRTSSSARSQLRSTGSCRSPS